MGKLFCGIDPGLNGGICFLEDGIIKEIHAMPTFKVETSTKKIRNYVDADKIKDIIKWHQNAHYYVEQVRSLHGMSAQSNFSMGHAVGTLHGCIRMLTSEFYLIRPVDWQKLVWSKDDYVINPVTKKRDTKATSAKAAARLYPHTSFLKSSRSKKPHDGMIDAALIAWSQFKGK